MLSTVQASDLFPRRPDAYFGYKMKLHYQQQEEDRQRQRQQQQSDRKEKKCFKKLMLVSEIVYEEKIKARTGR